MPEKQHLPYYTMGLLDFQKKFPTERACLQYLAEKRFPNGFLCPRCNSSRGGHVRTRGLWQCKWCRAQISVTAGTIFHRTRTPLQYWFWAIFLVAKDKRGHSALQLSKELNLPYERAWLILHKIRAAMAQQDMLYSLNGIVEMDEAYFGARNPGRCGRGTGRAKALVAVEVTSDNKPMFAKIRTIRRLDTRAVKAFARPRIARGSNIRTDGLLVYRGLADIGFNHEEIPATGKPKEELLQWVHIVISNAKAFITGTFHGLGKKHIQRYLDEFCYRFNRRHREEEIFDRLLIACLTAKPLIYDELTR